MNRDLPIQKMRFWGCLALLAWYVQDVLVGNPLFLNPRLGALAALVGTYYFKLWFFIIFSNRDSCSKTNDVNLQLTSAIPPRTQPHWATRVPPRRSRGS